MAIRVVLSVTLLIHIVDRRYVPSAIPPCQNVVKNCDRGNDQVRYATAYQNGGKSCDRQLGLTYIYGATARTSLQLLL